MAIGIVAVIALGAIAAAYVTWRVWQALRFRGEMLVRCPETHQPAAVKVDVARAAAKLLAGGHDRELRDCSRWPERGECDQDCLEQVERDPDNHRVWTIAARWFAGKKCVYCGKAIDTLSHFDRSPALLGEESKTAEWDEVPAENLPGEFSRDMPVCWNCHIAQTFLRTHPDLVVHRPGKERGPQGEYITGDTTRKSVKVSGGE
jgi:hypothetical protein